MVLLIFVTCLAKICPKANEQTLISSHYGWYHSKKCQFIASLCLQFCVKSFIGPHLYFSTMAVNVNIKKKKEVSRSQQKETFCCHPSLRTRGGGSTFGAAVSHPAAVTEVQAGGAGAVAFWQCMMCCDSGSRGWRAVTMRHHIASSPGTRDQHAGLAKKC